mmetsp:Transcript_146299/g.407540  ORF Transcript_146299/g.407540 Transcript_146299/m.407540 type:complete len:274 (+) Transcript_146299:645-1466(+)
MDINVLVGSFDVVQAASRTAWLQLPLAIAEVPMLGARVHRKGVPDARASSNVDVGVAVKGLHVEHRDLLLGRELPVLLDGVLAAGEAAACVCAILVGLAACQGDLSGASTCDSKALQLADRLSVALHGVAHVHAVPVVLAAFQGDPSLTSIHDCELLPLFDGAPVALDAPAHVGAVQVAPAAPQRDDAAGLEGRLDTALVDVVELLNVADCQADTLADQVLHGGGYCVELVRRTVCVVHDAAEVVWCVADFGVAGAVVGRADVRGVTRHVLRP